MRYMQGHFDRARTNVSRALIFAEGSGDTDAAVHAEWILGFVEHAVGVWMRPATALPEV